MDLDFSDDAKKMKPFAGATGMFDFGEKIMNEGLPLVFGRIKEFKPTFKEVKLFRKGIEKKDEAKKLNQRLDGLKQWNDNTGMKFITDTLFGQGFPLAPFPAVEKCLGMEPKDSSMEIGEGYAHLAYDFKVSTSNQKCLFDIKHEDNIKQKEIDILSHLKRFKFPEAPNVDLSKLDMGKGKE